MRVPFPLMLALLVPASTARVEPRQSPSDRIVQSSVAARRLNEAVQRFGELSHPTPVDEYLVGFALMELHQPLDAEPHLRAARSAGFADRTAWPTLDALLERARVFRELAPPRSPVAEASAEPAIAVFAGPPTEWSAPVLRAIPEFGEVGRRIFGQDLPPLQFYLFAERAPLDRFYGALFGTTEQTAWQDGTGTLGVVTFCEQDRRGETTRPAGEPETVSCVLHEFGHAWIGTYLMARHGREWIGPAMRRPWLDEGLADFIAALREPSFLERRAAWLRVRAAHVARPEFDEIAAHQSFYETGDVDVHYWISALFVAELLGPREKAPATIRAVLDAAGSSGDIDAAVAAKTGKDLREEFEKLVRRFW